MIRQDMLLNGLNDCTPPMALTRAVCDGCGNVILTVSTPADNRFKIADLLDYLEDGVGRLGGIADFRDESRVCLCATHNSAAVVVREVASRGVIVANLLGMFTAEALRLIEAGYGIVSGELRHGCMEFEVVENPRGKVVAP